MTWHEGAAARGQPSAGRILVIEDEESLREVMAVIVAMEGCEAKTAEDGTQALAIVQSWTPDLILLDLNMTGMDGKQFITRYHQSPLPHAPVILMTGEPLDDQAVQAMGATDRLTKPFEMQDLIGVIAQYAGCSEDKPTSS